ncbi:MAG: T9SS type A sorting domain-containing protein [Bacteroidales bacterium]|nr:T9SS type A sorting domain-containing protein [Bacteroidales bacterium]
MRLYRGSPPFQGRQNGTYTLTFDTQNLDLDYLHLIDNMTGADVDLLPLLRGQGGFNNHPNAVIAGEDPQSPAPSYTFTAKTTDYASRFRLVFSAPADETSANRPFAFISNGEIIVNGEGTLQVMDMTGRVIRCTDVARNISTLGMPTGVYVLRLVSGENVRTQKMVID